MTVPPSYNPAPHTQLGEYTPTLRERLRDRWHEWRLSARPELLMRVRDVERRYTEREKAIVQRVANCEGANRLRVGLLEQRIEDLEEQIRFLNPGLPPRRQPFPAGQAPT